MLTDEQLIDQIRSELCDELSKLHPSAALSSQTWPQARASRSRLSRDLNGWRPRARSLALLVSALATVVVAALAIVLLGEGRTNSAVPSQAGTVPATLQSAAALRAEMRTLRGRPIVILAWGTWCRPCLDELPAFASVATRSRQPVAFLGVDVDDRPSVAKSYLERHSAGYPNYRATLKQLHSIVRVPVVGLPTTFFISAAGKVIAQLLYPRPSRALRREVEILLRAQQLARLNEATARAATSRSSKVKIAPALLEYFGVFRNHRRGRDVSSLPPELARSWADQGLNVADAVLVPVGPGTGTWVIPGATQVCIFDDTGAGVCNSPTGGPGTPTAGGFYMRSDPGSRSGGYSILGLVPDGNRTVTISLADGSRQTIPVVNNVYSVSGLQAAPTAVELKDAAGAVKTISIG